MTRVLILLALAAAVTVVTLNGQRDRSQPIPVVRNRGSFDVIEATIPDMQAALASGRVTSYELVLLYMSRISQYEDLLNATGFVSRTALDEAQQLDLERASGRVRGPLHGIPIALKDNINTTNMPTTGGTLALAGVVPPFEFTTHCEAGTDTCPASPLHWRPMPVVQLSTHAWSSSS